MSTDQQSAMEGQPQLRMWRRILAWIRAYEDAMDASYDDFQDRRILALEREVARLRDILDPRPVAVGEQALGADP